jgi:hypothetical protein
MNYERNKVCNPHKHLRPGRNRKHLYLLVGLLGWAVSGCSFMIDPDRVQCSRNEECAQRGEAFAGTVCTNHSCQPPKPWECLDQVVWPPASQGNVMVALNLVDLVTQQPVSGVEAQVCNKLDTTCSSPLVSGLVSDSLGRLVFSIQSGFDGYLQSTSTGLMPFLYFFYPPVTSDRDVPAIPILQDTGLATFATLAGGNVMAERGHLLARAYNCLGKTAEGVRFSSPEGDNSTVPFYMIKGIPSIKNSETDSSGNGGLLNLPPGTATLTGRLDDGRTMGTLSATTRPGRITYIALVPTPR